MKRRVFLASGLASSVVLADQLFPGAFSSLQETVLHRALPEIATSVRYPGKDAGHRMREFAQQHRGDAGLAGRFGAPVREVDVLIVGSGAGALSCAWALRKAGHTDHLVMAGPAPLGNAAYGQNAASAYPQGAHYLPLPAPRVRHVRHLLADAGVLLEGLEDERPRYDERCLVHAPAERVLHDGRWHSGLVPPLGAEAQAQWQRVLQAFETLRTGQCAGNELFGFPRPEKVADGARELDSMTFAAWLEGQGVSDPMLRWYFDYCCRDDYGAAADTVSAYAGLNYFLGREGHGRNAENGAVLTWPSGLGHLARFMRSGLSERQHSEGMALQVLPKRAGWHEVLAMGPTGPQALRARRVVLGCPLFVARRIAPWAFEGLEAAPGGAMNPWLVANVTLRGFPPELPGEELSWDNVVAGSTGLGYVVATHQNIRTARPAQTVFTTYQALGAADNRAVRKELEQASPQALLERVAPDLDAAYGRHWRRQCLSAEITVHGHAMAHPAPGFLSEPLAERARQAVMPGSSLLFSHADLSGYSDFEEASWWGVRSAEALLGGTGRWTA